jgi:hypothetical protein
LKEQNQFKDFIGSLVNNYPFRLTEKELSKDFKLVFPLINRAGFLKRIENNNYVICPGADAACLREAYLGPKDRFYVNCECNESESLFKVDISEFLRYEFDFTVFLEWLSGKIGLEVEVKQEVDDLVWFLGQKGYGDSPFYFYFVRSKSEKVITETSNTQGKGNRVVIWLGEKSPFKNIPSNVMSVFEILELNKGGFAIRPGSLKKFEPAKLVAKSKDLVLDKNIVVHVDQNGKYALMFGRKKDGTYEVSKKLPPLAYKIILRLYDARNRADFAWSLSKFEQEGVVEYKRTALREIKKVNDLCRKYGFKKIFGQFVGKAWGLNKDLDQIV